MNCEHTTILGGRVRLVQPVAGYRVAVDPVLMAASVPARRDERVLDAGSGTGAAALCLAARVPGVDVTGLEIQPELVSLAEQGASKSSMADRVRFVVGDVLEPPPDVPPEGFHHVMANPPYMEAGKGRIPPDPSKKIATVEGQARLADWIAFCVSRVRTKGTVTFVHRADRIEYLLAALAGRVGDITVFPLWPGGRNASARGAKRVIVQGRKGSAKPSAIAAGLTLHDGDGRYTEAANAVLEQGAALTLAEP